MSATTTTETRLQAINGRQAMYLPGGYARQLRALAPGGVDYRQQRAALAVLSRSVDVQQSACSHEAGGS